MAKLRRSNDLIKSLQSDLSQIKVEDGAILVLRSDRDWKDAEMQRLQEEVNQSLPGDARCLLLVMPTDEAFETIPEPAARAIHTELTKIFMPDAISLAEVERHVMSAFEGAGAAAETMARKAFDSLRQAQQETKSGASDDGSDPA